MSDLVEFYTARLDEEEQAAQEGRKNYIAWLVFFDKNGAPRYTTAGAIAAGTARIPFGTEVRPEQPGIYDPARVLREVRAKRKILEDFACHQPHDPDWNQADMTVRILAEVHADHPEYREEFRPA